jgi:hypothetical protein
MSSGEARVFKEAVDGMPPHWFVPPGAQSLLKRYCSHASTAEFTAVEMRRAHNAPTTKENLEVMDRLSMIGCRESLAMANLATKLRMTPQSSKHRFTAEAEVRNTARVRPWEDNEPAA